jgi:hypothetical protein
MLLVLLIVVLLIVVALIASALGSDSPSPTRELPTLAPPHELTSSARREIPHAEEYDAEEYEEDDYEAEEAITVEEAMFTPARHDRALEGFFQPAGAFSPVGTNEADENSVCYTYGQKRGDCLCDRCKEWRRARGN